MKRLFFCGVVLLGLSACKSSTSWSQTDKDAFMNTCVSKAQSSAGMDETKAKDYCSCMQEKVEKKYPNSSDAAKMTISDITEMAKGCVK